MDNEYEIELDLRGLLLYLLRRGKVIAVSVLVCAVFGFLLSFFALPPVYEVSTRMYVLNRTSENVVTYSDYQIANQIIEDYKVLITGQNVTKQVISELQLDMTIEKLEKMISVTAPQNTRVLQITVKDTDPLRAVRIANCVREVASEQIQKIMDVESVHLVYEAEIPEEAAGPDVLMITLIAAIVGMVTVVVVLTIIHVMDDTIRTEEDVEMYLGVSVLGVLPADAEMGRLADDTSVANKRRRRGCKAAGPGADGK